MTRIDLSAQKPSLEELLALAKREAGLVLTKGDRPVARLVPFPEQPAKRVAPLHPGAWELRQDFDQHHSEDFLLGQG